ncbi:MAG: ATP-binding protein [Sulfurovum sp.]|nr:ATP-binding protein [Sulfurovum sp.]
MKTYQLQIIQHTIASYYAIPLHLYNNNASEEMYAFFMEDKGKNFHTQLKEFLSSYAELKQYTDSYLDNKETLEEVFTAIHSILICKTSLSKDFTYKIFTTNLSEVFNQDDFDEIIKICWATKQSYILPFMRRLKADDKTWKLLSFANINSSQTLELVKITPTPSECFIGIHKMLFGLDDNYSLHIGRYFRQEKDNDDEFAILNKIKDMASSIGTSSGTETELLALAQLRESLSTDRLIFISKEIKKIFNLLKVITNDSDKKAFSRTDIEQIVFFAILVTRICPKQKELLKKLSLSIKNNTALIQYDGESFIYIKDIPLELESSCFYYQKKEMINKEELIKIEREFRKVHKRFTQNNKIREFEYKESLHSNTELNTEGILRKISHTTLAKSSTFLKYSILKDKIYAGGQFPPHKDKDNKHCVTNDKKPCPIQTTKRNDILKCPLAHQNCHENIVREVIEKFFNASLPYKVGGIANNILGLPIVHNQKLLGVLLVEGDQDDSFSKDTIRTIQFLSSVLAEYRYKKIFDSNFFKVFNSFSANVKEVNFSQMSLQQICEDLTELFFCYGVAIWRKEEENYITVASSLDKENMSNKIISQEKNSIIARVEATKKYISISNLNSYNDTKTKDQPTLEFKMYDHDKRINALEIHPILDDNQNFMAGISIYNRNIEEFKLIETETLTSIIESLKLFFSITHRIEEQGRIIRDHALHDTNQHLLTIDNKCHELNEMINKYYRDIPQAYKFIAKVNDIYKRKDDIKQSFKYLTGKVLDFKQSTTIDSELIEFKNLKDKQIYNTSVYDVLQIITHSKLKIIKSKNLKIDISDIKKLYLNIPSSVLTKILQNLFFNAIKYSYHNTKISIHFRIKKSALLIECTNIGLGISEEEIYSIFEYESRGEMVKEYIDIVDGKEIKYLNNSSSSHENVGVGLYITRELVKHWGGTLKLIGSFNAHPKQEKLKMGNKYTNTFRLRFPFILIQKDT